jgi:hypothetical protein
MSDEVTECEKCGCEIDEAKPFALAVLELSTGVSLS